MPLYQPNHWSIFVTGVCPRLPRVCALRGLHKHGWFFYVIQCMMFMFVLLKREMWRLKYWYFGHVVFCNHSHLESHTLLDSVFYTRNNSYYDLANVIAPTIQILSLFNICCSVTILNCPELHTSRCLARVRSVANDGLVGVWNVRFHLNTS